MSVEVTQLDNGLTVVSQAMPHLESAALGVWVGTGSRAEADDEHGIAHLLEHMAFKGTARRSAKAIAEEIEAVGGELNAATSVETTAYYARVLRDDVPLALDILADILQNSVFDPIELAREQHVILQEIGAAMDVPDDRVFDLFQEAAFPEQSIGRPILGTVETVKQFRPEAIRAYLNREYRTERMVVAAAGAIDHDRLVADTTERFVGFSKAAENGRSSAAYRGGESRENRDLQEVQITLGFAGKPILGKDYFKVQILAAILGGGMSS
ncbi:MAG: insulinase family protein, partial [Hyphomicrobiales bacterium]|nr:insulinase family protein [Hyphomicrobiales bacterium]